VNRVRDQLLTRARFTANEHGRVRLRHLRDLFVHLARRSARPDDVRKVVPLAQLLAQVRVLVHQPPALLFDQALNVQRLRNHRADDAEELDAALVVALRLELQVHGEGADGLTLHVDRHADEAQLVARNVGAPRHTVQELGLLADARDDNRLAALHDLTRDPFAHLERGAACPVIEPFDGFNLQLAFAQQRDHAAHDAVVADQDLKHSLHRRLEVQRARQRLTDLEQGRQASGIAGNDVGVGCWFGGGHGVSYIPGDMVSDEPTRRCRVMGDR
jgi:hypothetical protein